jgi:hypothetical protein
MGLRALACQATPKNFPLKIEEPAILGLTRVTSALVDTVALYVMAVSRIAHDARTRAYVRRRTTEGLSEKEIRHCLKRYVDRELYKVLTRPKTQAPSGNDLPSAA